MIFIFDTFWKLFPVTFTHRFVRYFSRAYKFDSTIQRNGIRHYVWFLITYMLQVVVLALQTIKLPIRQSLCR